MKDHQRDIPIWLRWALNRRINRAMTLPMGTVKEDRYPVPAYLCEWSEAWRQERLLFEEMPPR